MKITLDVLMNARVVPFPLEITNYLLTLFGGEASEMRSVSNYVNTDDFISFCTTPDYVACRTTNGDIATCAVTVCKITDDNRDVFGGSVYQLSDRCVLYINTINSSIVAVQAYYDEPVHKGTQGLYDVKQAVDTFRRIVGESYNVH